MSIQNKSFCVYPFIHLHVNEKNHVKLCCVAHGAGTPVATYSKDFDFVNDPGMQQIRKDMLAGNRVAHCSECYSYEDAGSPSLRTAETEFWMGKLGITDIAQVPTTPLYYDIRNDNLCNLGCRMCTPQFSSQLAKEYQKIGWWGHPTDPKEFGFSDVVDLDTVQKIYVAGGEPSLMPEFKKFLQTAISAGRTDIDIRMNSNVTNLNKEYVALLRQFNHVEITCSVDGYDQVNKYIRWPADWQTIVNNIHGLLKITPYVSINVTVGIWNVSRLSELVFFIESEFPTCDILLHKLIGVPEQQFVSFPDKELAIRDLERLKSTKHYQNNLDFYARVNYFIDELANSVLDLSVLTRFFKFNDRLDQSRGIKLNDYIPELEKCRDYLTKQT